MNNRNILVNLFKSEIIRNSSTLISGTVLAQLIPILLQPVLRRIYSPDIFGVYSVYLSALGILIVISSFKYELAIILPKKDKEAANILMLSSFINFIFNVFLLIIIVLYKEKIALFLNISTELSFYLYFIPLGTFLFNFYQSLNLWLTRKDKFLSISKNKLIRRGVEGVTQVSFKIIKSTSGLLVGDILGHLAHVANGVRQIASSGFSLKLLSITKLKYVSKKYAVYPKFNMIPSFMSACSYLLPVIFINKFYTAVETGYFDLSKLVLSIPLALIATSISNVLLQSITKRYQQNKSIILDLYPIMILIFIIALVEIIIIFFFGEKLFSFLFGMEWSISGQISEILVWAYAFNFFTASFSSVYIALKRIKLLSAWQTIYFISVFSLILVRNYPFFDFIKIFTTVQLISCIVSIIFMAYIVFGYERKIA